MTHSYTDNSKAALFYPSQLETIGPRNGAVECIDVHCIKVCRKYFKWSRHLCLLPFQRSLGMSCMSVLSKQHTCFLKTLQAFVVVQNPGHTRAACAETTARGGRKLGQYC